MIVDLVTMPDHARAFEAAFEAAQIDLESETARVVGATRARGTIKKKIAQTDVEGDIETTIEIECARCLQPVAEKLDFQFRAAFVTPDFYTEQAEAELKADDLEVALYAGDKIDLRELVREQILLNLPEQVFCREDCRGLCQKCGANRNLIDCNCEEKEADPRWAALKDLK